MAAEEPKRKRGRPAKLPTAGRHCLRLEVLAFELAEVRAAVAKLGISQAEFTRLAVLEKAWKVNAAK